MIPISLMELEEEFKWHEKYHHAELEKLKKLKEEWHHLYSHIPRLFHFIRFSFEREFCSHVAGEDIETVHQILKPFTDRVVRGTESCDRSPCWVFDLTVAERPIQLTIVLYDPERYCVPKTRVITREKVIYEGCPDILDELAGIEED